MEENTQRKLNINWAVINQLDKLHLNASHLWVLETVYLELNMPIFDSLVATLDRKGYLSASKDTINITEAGKKLYELLINLKTDYSVNIKSEIKKVKAAYNLQFLEWWAKYPPGSSWRDDEEHRNKLYEGGRSFKVRKDDCEKKYIEALSTGYSHSDMLAALDFEIAQKKKESRRTGENKFTYMVNTYTYLYEKLYEGMIEMIKSGNDYKETPEQNSGAIMQI